MTTTQICVSFLLAADKECVEDGVLAYIAWRARGRPLPISEYVEVDEVSKEDGEYGPAFRLYATYAYLCAYTFLCYRLLQLCYFTIHPVPHQVPDPSPRTHSSEGQAVIHERVPKLI